MEFILQKKKKTFIGHLAIYFEENEKSRYFSLPSKLYGCYTRDAPQSFWN
jgi:hypothetical protein